MSGFHRVVLGSAIALSVAGLGVVHATADTGSASAAPLPEKIVYDRYTDSPNGGEIYVMNPDGSGQTALTNTTADESDPAFSPDARQIAYERGHDIWIMNYDGSGQTRLTHDPETEVMPSFSPDGTKILYTQETGGGAILMSMNTDGSNQTPIDQPALQASLFGVYSPDGAKIAFTKFDVAFGGADLYLMYANGDHVRRLTGGSPFETLPSFSPDGHAIAFTAQSGGNANIMRIRLDGKGLTALTTDPGNDTSPAYSPGGDRIVFSSTRDGGDGDIWTMNSGGGGLVQLTHNSDEEGKADWGPKRPTPVSQACASGTAAPAGYHLIVGTDGNDRLNGTPGPDVIRGEGGNDVISGHGGDDILCGGAGRDTIYGQMGRDRIYGNGGRDLLMGGGGNDFIDGGPDDDVIYGGNGRDHLHGNKGDDKLYGGPGEDYLDGGSGKNVLVQN